MSWIVDLRSFVRARPDRVGPGRIIIVVGPSGAGKDTLIDGARSACTGDHTVVFPRRIITRPVSDAEDNATVSEEAFNRMIANGDFALSWSAHGLCYGIPSSIDDDIRSGRTVVCNVSRTIVGEIRRRYAFVTVVLVTAPPKILEARLARRARPSDGDVAARMARTETLTQSDPPDVTIKNTGDPAIGVRRLLNVLRSDQIFVVL